MWIDPKLIKALKDTGLTSKEMADRFRKVWEGLPTTKELANNFYDNLKWWRNKCQ